VVAEAEADLCHKPAVAVVVAAVPGELLEAVGEAEAEADEGISFYLQLQVWVAPVA
jgi:hypothetical protein